MNSSSFPSFHSTSDSTNKDKISSSTQTFLTFNDLANLSSTDALMSNEDYTNIFFPSSKTTSIQGDSTNESSGMGNKKNMKSLKINIMTDAFKLFKQEYLKSNPQKEEKDIVLVWERLESNIKKIYISNAENERKKSKGKN